MNPGFSGLPWGCLGGAVKGQLDFVPQLFFARHVPLCVCHSLAPPLRLRWRT